MCFHSLGRAAFITAIRPAARALDLKTGTLFWPEHFDPLPRYPALRRNLKCDVAIVGAGLTGATVAHALTKVGLEVVVLDKRDVARGSTSASTALVLYEIDVPLSKLIRMRGERQAVQSFQCCLHAIEQLDELAGELGPSVGFERRASLYLASRDSHVRALRSEFAVRKRFGLNLNYLTRADLREQFHLQAPAAILSADAAELNPMAMTFRLIEKCAKAGGRVFAGTCVQRLSEDRRVVVLETAAGHRIKARYVIMAAGYETDPAITKRLVKLRSTYVMATAPVKDLEGWQQRCLIWETARPYYYLRTTPDNRLMIGGADEDFVDAARRDKLIKAKTRLLQQRLRELVPTLESKPAFAWAGTFGETRDGLPYIGPAQPSSRVLYALCYGANGTNFALIAANILRDRMTGKRNAAARLFALDR